MLHRPGWRGSIYKPSISRCDGFCVGLASFAVLVALQPTTRQKPPADKPDGKCGLMAKFFILSPRELTLPSTSAFPGSCFSMPFSCLFSLQNPASALGPCSLFPQGLTPFPHQHTLRAPVLEPCHLPPAFSEPQTFRASLTPRPANRRLTNNSTWAKQRKP